MTSIGKGKSWGKVGTLVHCSWECKMVQQLWKLLQRLIKKVKYRITIWFSNSTSGYIPKSSESKYSNIYLYTHIYNIIIYNNQKVEATQVPFDSWMNKQNVAYTKNGLLFSLKEEGHSNICYNMDETLSTLW